MGSTFGSFEIGRRGIHVMQKGAQITGQNIANANTEGYSRQVMTLKALVPPAVAGVDVQPGYGVNVSAIRRVTSEFYDGQIRQSLSQRDYWGQLGETMAALEVIFLEPGDTGINIYLSEFFDAWQEVSTNPESYAARVSLVEQAETLSGIVREIYKGIEDLFADTEKELDNCLGEINNLAQTIAALNEKIVFQRALGEISNELLDERDLYLRELSGLTNIQVLQKENGAVEVICGGCALLHDDLFFPLEKVAGFDEETRERVLMLQNKFGFKVTPTAGKLSGLLESYNEILPFNRATVDDLVFNLVQEVNRLHREGYGLDESTGQNFFEPWGDPMPGDIVITPQNDVVPLSFPPGAKDSQKLMDGEYHMESFAGFSGAADARAISTYSLNNLPLVGSVDVDPSSGLGSSMIFEVAKLDGDDVYLRYNYIHTKVNGDGDLQAFAGEGIKKLKAGQLNEGINFGTETDWALGLDIELENIRNFCQGDKFIIQVTAAGGGSSGIRLQKMDGESGAGPVYEVIAPPGITLQGEQMLEFFQLDDKSGEHRKVGLIARPGELSAQADGAAFTVEPYEPEHLREYIHRAAAKIQVSAHLLENKDAVGASGAPGLPGDGSAALGIYRLREKLQEGLDGTTFEDYFRGRIVDLGVSGREAQRLEYNMNAIYENMSEQAESVSGVSLDDEMLSLVQYQHSYNAAAQFLSIIDEMLETLINGIR